MPNNTTIQIVDYISYLSKNLTQKITDFLNSNGYTWATTRWVSTLILTLGLLLFYIAIKIAKPIVKWLLILLSVILVIGIWIPW